MSDIKLFHLKNDNVTELTGSAVKIEKSLQEQIERNPDTYLGVRFLATEYSAFLLICLTVSYLALTLNYNYRILSFIVISNIYF